MTDGQRDLFGFVGAALAVMIGLFVVQEWYGTFVEVSAHATLAEAGANSEVAGERAAEAQKLASARVPIEQAMRALGERPRAGFSSVTPVPSEDLSAMSGWIHGRRFVPYVPRSATTPVMPVEVVPSEVPTDAVEAPAGAVEAPTGAPTQAPIEAPTPAGAQE